MAAPAIMRIFHLFDRNSPDEAMKTALFVMQRLPTGRFTHCLGALDGEVLRRWANHGGDCFAIRHRFRVDAALPSRLRQFVSDCAIDVVHAWGMDAAIAAAACTRGAKPTVSTFMVPPLRSDWSRWFQAVDVKSFTVLVCSCGLVERRLVEGGVERHRCVVIRPGVDFHALHEARRTASRSALLLPADGPVLATLPPPSRRGGHFDTAWASAILAQIDRSLRLVVPGTSKEQRRLRRLVESVRMPELMIFTGNNVALPMVLAVADVVVVAAVDDIPTAPLAWAMAAGVPIVGSAVPAVTEFLADRHNSLLSRPGRPAALAARIQTALEDRSLTVRVADTARAQAFEVFSLRRMVDQYRRLYENLAAGRPPAEGITDAALT